MSPGREVCVTAGAEGRVDRVDISHAALSRGAGALSRLVTDTVRAAQREAADTALRRMTQSLGDSSPLVAVMRERFGNEYAAATTSANR
ncbi:YbaB/EbfC family nucleoid-associated protein [Microbacterium testaceum]|uniref:YbaB/EbfC family nucleoid-associated protein n=1 Tax=Microbacterium testaceum TaxID=2033 RepID=UPI003B436EA7